MSRYLFVVAIVNVLIIEPSFHCACNLESPWHGFPTCVCNNYVLLGLAGHDLEHIKWPGALEIMLSMTTIKVHSISTKFIQP